MSIDFDPSRQRWRVRWREDGRQRSRRFGLREEAVAFEQQLAADPRAATPPLPAEPPGGNGIHAYDTNAGTRYRFLFRQSDGTQSKPARLHEPARGGNGAAAPGRVH